MAGRSTGCEPTPSGTSGGGSRRGLGLIRRPSDLGHSNDGYELPPLVEREHLIQTRKAVDGWLFEKTAETLQEQRAEQRRTLPERCDAAAGLLDGDAPGIAWCQLNDEGDRLERTIPGAVQVSGADRDEAKEEKLAAFLAGEARVLVTKPTVAGFGLNLQHCSRMTSFPSHSFEAHYQSVRRCWRFGQTRPVHVHLVTTDGSRGVLASLQRKQADADRMFRRLVTHMTDGLAIAAGRNFTRPTEAPTWLTTN